MSQQCCCSNVLLYIFSLKASNVQEEINFSKLRKQDRKPNPQVNVAFLCCFTSKTIITVSAIFTLQTTLAVSWDEHCGGIIQVFFLPFYSFKERSPTTSLSPRPDFSWTQLGSSISLSFPFLPFPSSAQGSCFILN